MSEPKTSSDFERGIHAGQDAWRRGSTRMHKTAALKAKQALRMIKEKPGITSDEIGEFCGGLKLLQKHGLVYFKAPMHRDEKGRKRFTHIWFLV